MNNGAAFVNGVMNGTIVSMFQALNKDVDYENLSINSTSVKAHQHSAGTKKGQYHKFNQHID
jgi:hypothetical protein